MSTRLALRDTSGPLTDLLKKLSGANGEHWLRKLKKMLRNEKTVVSVSDFEVWRTVTLGYSPLKFFHELHNNGSMNIRVSDHARAIIFHPNFTVSPQEQAVKLARLHWSELGFESPPTYGELNQRALEMGFALCPPEVGPVLAIEYPDFPEGEKIQIGMEPAPARPWNPNEEILCSFALSRPEHEHQVWLSGGGYENARPCADTEVTVYVIP